MIFKLVLNRDKLNTVYKYPNKVAKSKKQQKLYELLKAEFKEKAGPANIYQRGIILNAVNAFLNNFNEIELEFDNGEEDDEDNTCTGK